MFALQQNPKHCRLSASYSKCGRKRENIHARKPGHLANQNQPCQNNQSAPATLEKITNAEEKKLNSKKAQEKI